MSKIYLVTKGDYSDYRVEGVASTKSLAKRMAFLLSDRYSMANVEEYELDSFDVASEGGKKTWCVSRNFKNDKPFVVGPYPSNSSDNYVYAFTLNRLETEVVAETKEDAIKIANDRFAKKRAEMIGL